MYASWSIYNVNLIINLIFQDQLKANFDDQSRSIRQWCLAICSDRRMTGAIGLTVIREMLNVSIIICHMRAEFVIWV